MHIGFKIFIGLVVLGLGAWIYAVSNVERWKYTVLEKDGAIEVRDYPALVVAEVTRRGNRNSAVRAGFGPLAGYIFAKNRDGESISMTAPVTQALAPPVSKDTSGQANGADEIWIVRFIMPAKYTLDTLPKAPGDDVRLLTVAAGRFAAIQFSGVATDALIATNEATLRAWLADRKMTINGEPTYAYYNDPFTPGPLRRNEVLFAIQTP